ncbi:protein-disulfide isomerase [Candidatus Gottesmanbacteria bacterium CG11_big_fil_rev_8_21_14_0_20_37_11]|uniref:Protein-disulfide isomerase n=1 Tax=Candidatus Gottesmanbacteria bacterium CG11_big_fil_rev_8_21_14_0_20_37_11 TaxID=1974575 RepID=A0A2H0NHR2_9BACT|nr:MAG: protein-disulfide isomerase [Candidatus Gottesmanbacteria bacterium CG11_big_fil_rev_8_21_14_0_20_37_11]
MDADKKVIIGSIFATIIVIVGAVFFTSKSNSPNNEKKIDESILIRENSNKISSPGAELNLIEFADYKCPACATYLPVIKDILKEYKGRINYVYRHYPLPQHKNAYIAAQAAEAAGKQGKYWEYHEMLYSNQSDWSSENNVTDKFTEYAKDLQLDINKFKSDLDMPEIKQKIEQDIQDGNRVKLSATPTFFLDGEQIQNPESDEDFKTLIKAAILKIPVSPSPGDQVHIHADFKMYLDNKLFDFSPEKYYTRDGKELDPAVHFHDKNSNFLHIHKKGITLSYFFKTLGMDLTNDCLTLDDGKKYCSDEVNSLKLIVNGQENKTPEKYEPKDLDRILVSFGHETEKELQDEISSVTDLACIYSLKCPQRGTPPPEKCEGGLGSGCDNEDH